MLLPYRVENAFAFRAIKKWSPGNKILSVPSRKENRTSPLIVKPERLSSFSLLLSISKNSKSDDLKVGSITISAGEGSSG